MRKSLIPFDGGSIALIIATLFAAWVFVQAPTILSRGGLLSLVAVLMGLNWLYEEYGRFA